MSRQSISFTDPNTQWLKSKVEVEGEYASNSELINDLIRKARAQEAEIEMIRAKLVSAENSGFSTLTREEILEKSKAELRRNGEL